jgi:hypothetical protein
MGLAAFRARTFAAKLFTPIWGAIAGDTPVIIPEDAFYYHGRRKYYENPPALKKAIKRRELLNQKLEKKQDAIIAAPTPILWQGNSDVEKLQRQIAEIQQSIVKNEEKIRIIIMQHNERMAELEEEEFLMLTY